MNSYVHFIIDILNFLNSLFTGPMTLITVINGQSKLFEDKNGVVNVSCNEVADVIRNSSTGMMFLAFVIVLHNYNVFCNNILLLL